MNILSTHEIRQLFLNYFQKLQHTFVASSPLVPRNDPTLLFTNAGMVQFKDVFLGKEKRNYHRATSSQRCVRAGGKHNDLENVGYTARHHTFFEMLGNFSFGDYFKREAIQFAWEFITEVLNIPAEKLWITVYKDDDEAADIWLKEIKIDPTRFGRCDEDNFWSMGPTGPCGSCSEIFYDHGPEIPGGPPGSPDAEGDRYIEIWNLVFMQFDRAEDGTLTALPKPSVDTGMGLERIAAVMQGVHSNYEIDLFQHLIKAVAQLASLKDLTNTSLRVIADHIRSSAFLILDGVIPANEGRGYVLRRIIRRALRHGNKIGLTQSFFFKLVAPLVQMMGDAYPELRTQQKNIEKLLQAEEEQFSLTLATGLKLFNDATKDLTTSSIPGETVFKLYDTYGFPVDLTADIARERGLTVDHEGFEACMQRQRDRSRQSGKFTAEYSIGSQIETPTEFIGYKNLRLDVAPDESEILAIYHAGKTVDELKAGEEGSVILSRTPFYAQSGGQVGDQGVLRQDNALFNVIDTIKQGHAHVHIGVMKQGSLRLGEKIHALVNVKRREATVLNHTGTHLLHMVLREILGPHVIQKGSLVEPERLRFDFSHSDPLTLEELHKIEHRVNEEIRLNHSSNIEVTTPDEAIASGAMGLFGEKYGDEVRVISFGASKELCGGTHAHHTGDIGLFKITSESGVAAGIRRIEAVTGEGALLWLEKRDQENKLKHQAMDEKIRLLEKQLNQLQNKLASNTGQDLLDQIQEIGEIKLISTIVSGLDSKALRQTVDQLKDKIGQGVVVLAVEKDGKVSIIAGVTKDLTGVIKAGELVNMIAQQVGGKGGGRPDLAEAGGNQPENLKLALNSVSSWILSKVKQ